MLYAASGSLSRTRIRRVWRSGSSASSPARRPVSFLSRSPVRAAGRTLRYAVVVAGGHAGRRRCRRRCRIRRYQRPGLDSASGWATLTARPPTQTGCCLGLATEALLSRAASWSASTPGPPLGVSRRPTRRVARILAYRRAGPGSNRLAAIDGLREEAAGTCSTRLGVEVCGPRRPRRVHRRSKGLRRLLARTRRLRAVVARSRVGRFQRPDGPRRRAVRRPLSKPG
jgi:hypothetical protein